MENIKLSIATINVRGLNKNDKRHTIFKWIKDKNIDFTCLQETFCTKATIAKFSRDWNGDSYHCLTNSSHSRGVSILIRKGLEYKLLNKYFSDDGRKLLLNIEFQNHTICIVNAYAPNDISSRKDFFKRISKWIRQKAMNESTIILAGDMNSPFNYKYLNDTLKCLNVDDTWKHLYKDKPLYTFYDTSRPSYKSCLDYIFVSQSITGLLKSCNVFKVPHVPDHRALIVLMDHTMQRGKGYWILNTNILEHQVYQKGIIDVIKNTVKEYINIVNNKCLWDFCKVRIREFSLAYSSKLAKMQNLKIKTLESQLADFESNVHLYSPDTEHTEHLKKAISMEYDLLYKQRAQGAQIRSKAKWIESGEKSTKYFLSLEKRHQTNNSIYTLKNNTGVKLSSTDHILGEASSFYKKLYTSTNIPTENIKRYLANIKIEHKLVEAEQALCEGPVTEKECYDVIKCMKSNKSPGDDGLPAEFYKVFWVNIKELVLNSYHEAYATGELSDSQKRSVLTLIFKKGDRELLVNYRPLSLTNTDYKILAFALANRLHKVINEIVHKDQTAYIKKRFIGQNIRILLDVIDYTERKNIPGSFFS